MIKNDRGMALVTVLIFSVVAIIVITLGITLMIIQTGSSSKATSSKKAIFVAESAMENALIRLLRNPSYAGETLTFSDGTATIIVTGNTTKTVSVSSDVFSSNRTIEVVLSELNGVNSIISWKEVQ
jgi:Tfp pilus assembly protein PilX